MLLPLPRGTLKLPIFLPDATVGVVRAVDGTDLQTCGVQALVMNTFHLMQHPGSSTVDALGGLHKMSGWPRPIITDSGGFQAYSLIRENSKYGKLTNDGIVIQPDGARRKFKLTPEKCVQLQIRFGADVVMCLDDCTHVDDAPETQRTAVARTVAWVTRGKAEFTRLVEQKGLVDDARPLLFAVIQGGGSAELRRNCAEALLAIGFDGFGYGGWPLDGEGKLVSDMLAYVRELVPDRYPLHALGVGHPANVVRCARMGYTMFDCALPTRDARRGRLYTFADDTTTPSKHTLYHQDAAAWFKFLYITDDKYIKAAQPVSAACDCTTCRTYARGYLHHLYRYGEATFMRLATIHNLRFMARLMEIIRSDDIC